jgi:hypothetical protein
MSIVHAKRATAISSDPQVMVVVLSQGPYAGVKEPISLGIASESRSVEGRKPTDASDPEFSIVSQQDGGHIAGLQTVGGGVHPNHPAPKMDQA